jgi:hypothetical protein
MCERSWYSVLRINMQTTHAMLLWQAHDGRNADDVISARRPAVISTLAWHVYDVAEEGFPVSS